MLCVLACTSRNVHASLPQTSTTNFAIGDHLAPEQKRNTASGITRTLKDHTPAFSSTATSLAVKTRAAQSHKSTSPHTADLFCAIFTPFLPQRCSFDPAFTLFLPRFYPSGAAFTPLLPCFYPNSTPFLPRFYPFFTLARRVKSHVYPVFTPVLPYFYHFTTGKIPRLPLFYPRFTPPSILPRFSTLRTFLPQFYPRVKRAYFY